MTLTEHSSRLEILVKIPNYHADTCLKALQSVINDYGSQHFRTITFDNGSEFSLLNSVSGIDIYFAHPYSPWGGVALMKTLMVYFENSFLKESHLRISPLLMFKRFNTRLITVQESV